MNNGNWDKQEKIFHEALALNGGERNSFLLKACSEDEIQISEIESLILAFENDGNFLEQPVFDDGLRLLGENNPQNPANSIIGFYQIRGKIGEGGMGEVYDALDTKLNRRVALKFLPGSLNDDNLAKRQLIREAQAAALLDHPNICAVHGIEQTEQHHFIVMQFIEGITLAEFIKKPPVNQPPLAAVARQIISAVAFAHSHGVIHRDLKPANIMIKNDGQIKVLDFGLAKTVGQISNFDRSEENNSLTSQKGLIIGTVSYMSPEQLRGERLDFQTDIFSVGIILYELVFRTNPFARSSQAETIASILSGEPALAKDFKTNNHDGLPTIIQKCLQKSKAERFQSAAEILVELDADEQKRLVKSGFNIRGKTAAAFLIVVLIFSAALAYLYFYPPQPPKHTFAVLPITNETEQSEYQYLADGLTRDLIESLSGLSALDVKKESYISRFREQPATAQTAGRELNVDAVLAASIRRRADSLFLNLKIVKTADGSILDAAEFPVKESDLIAVREKIAARIIVKMQPRLTAQEKTRLAQNNTQSPEAMRLYFLGRFYWNRRGPGDLKNAIQYFTEATNQDPSYARAWAGLADSYAFLSVPGQSGTISSEEAIRLAKAAAGNALQIDETLSEPYSSLGTIKLKFEWDWVGAEQNFRTAISLDPEYAPARYGLSNLLLITGRYEEALAEAQKTKELDPFSISSELNIGRIYYFKRDDAKATQIYQELLKKNPDNIRVLFLLGFQYLKIGRLKEATEIYEKIYDSNPLLAAAALGYCYGKSAQKARARKVLQKLEQLSEENYVSAQEKAIIYLGSGDADKVYAYLEQACREKFPAFPYLISDPLLDEIRSDRRFLNLKQCARL